VPNKSNKASSPDSDVFSNPESPADQELLQLFGVQRFFSPNSQRAHRSTSGC